MCSLSEPRFHCAINHLKKTEKASIQREGAVKGIAASLDPFAAAKRVSATTKLLLATLQILKTAFSFSCNSLFVDKPPGGSKRHSNEAHSALRA